MSLREGAKEETNAANGVQFMDTQVLGCYSCM